MAGIAVARRAGHDRRRPFKITVAMLRLGHAAMGKLVTRIAYLCTELGITRHAPYWHVAPDSQLRADGNKFLSRR